jgi:hypothetical protein
LIPTAKQSPESVLLAQIRGFAVVACGAGLCTSEIDQAATATGRLLLRMPVIASA